MRRGLATNYRIYQSDPPPVVNAQALAGLMVNAACLLGLAAISHGWAGLKARAGSLVKETVGLSLLQDKLDALFVAYHQDSILARSQVGRQPMALIYLNDLARQGHPVTVYVVQTGRKPRIKTWVKGPLTSHNRQFTARDRASGQTITFSQDDIRNLFSACGRHCLVVETDRRRDG